MNPAIGDFHPKPMSMAKRTLSNQPYFYILVFLILTSCRLNQEKKRESTGPSDIVSIRKARNLKTGLEVRVEGTISVASGTFSSSIPFGYALQDKTGGIYVIEQDLSEGFKFGEMVVVYGILDESNNMRVIKETTTTRTGSGNAVSALTVKTGNVNESNEGMILSTSGTIDSLVDDLPYGHKIYINDGSGALNVFVNASTGLLDDGPKWRISDSVSVIGFAGQFKEEYEIEPRTKDDITIFPNQ